MLIGAASYFGACQTVLGDEGRDNLMVTVFGDAAPSTPLRILDGQGRPLGEEAVRTDSKGKFSVNIPKEDFNNINEVKVDEFNGPETAIYEEPYIQGESVLGINMLRKKPISQTPTESNSKLLTLISVPLVTPVPQITLTAGSAETESVLKKLFTGIGEASFGGIVGNAAYALVSSFFAASQSDDSLILDQLQTIENQLDALHDQVAQLSSDLDGARVTDLNYHFGQFIGLITNISDQAKYLNIDPESYAGFDDKYGSDVKKSLEILHSGDPKAIPNSFVPFLKDIRAWDTDHGSHTTSFTNKLISVTDISIYHNLRNAYYLLNSEIDNLANTNSSHSTAILIDLYDMKNKAYTAYAVALGMIDRLNKINKLMQNNMSPDQGHNADEMDSIYYNLLGDAFSDYKTDVDKTLSNEKSHLGFLHVKYCSKLSHSIEVKLDSDNTHVFEVWSTLAPGQCLDSYPNTLSGDNAVHLQTTAYGQAEDHEGGRVPITTERALNVDDKNRELTNVDGASYHPSKTNERNVVMTIASCESQIDNKQLHWWNTTRYTVWKCKGDAIVTPYNIDDPKTPPTCPAPGNLIAKKDGSNVDVTWSKQDNIKTYKIFDYNIKEIGMPINGNLTQFTDKNVGPSNNYSYFVQSTCLNGTQSTLSKVDTTS